LAASGYDILANHAFEMRFGGSWITEARKNPELFGSLYRRTEVLQAQQAAGVELRQVEGVYPATYVITYPAARSVKQGQGTAVDPGKFPQGRVRETGFDIQQG